MTSLLTVGIIAVIVGTLADWYTTQQFRKVGIGEANPIARKIMELVARRGGGLRAQVFVAALLFDAIVISVVTFALLRFSGEQAAGLWLLAAGAAQLAVAWRNRALTKR